MSSGIDFRFRKSIFDYVPQVLGTFLIGGNRFLDTFFSFAFSTFSCFRFSVGPVAVVVPGRSRSETTTLTGPLSGVTSARSQQLGTFFDFFHSRGGGTPPALPTATFFNFSLPWRGDPPGAADRHFFLTFHSRGGGSPPALPNRNFFQLFTPVEGGARRRCRPPLFFIFPFPWRGGGPT